jgi:pimeloyl-ACP methyl ester carboxylesterase
MTFDFRGHGENVAGQYCTLGRDEALDVIAAAKFLRNHEALQGKPLFVYGFSMGAVASVEAQSRATDLFDAMILDCPFDSSERVIRHNLRNLKFSLWGYECEVPGLSLLQKYAFHPYVQLMIKTLLKTVAQLDTNPIQTNICPSHPAESAKKITVPCFFIHCKNDQKVRVDQVMAVYNSAAGYKRLWLTNGRRHFDSFFYDPEKYTEQIRAFCTDILRKKYQKADQARIIEDKDSNEFVMPSAA